MARRSWKSAHLAGGPVDLRAPHHRHQRSSRLRPITFQQPAVLKARRPQRRAPIGVKLPAGQLPWPLAFLASLVARWQGAPSTRNLSSGGLPLSQGRIGSRSDPRQITVPRTPISTCCRMPGMLDDQEGEHAPPHATRPSGHRVVPDRPPWTPRGRPELLELAHSDILKLQTWSGRTRCWSAPARRSTSCSTSATPACGCRIATSPSTCRAA
jgi:hypothetical protein